MAATTIAIYEGRVRSMEHDGCKLCKYENCSIESKECVGCKQNAVDKYTRMTNADRIRSFSDEELAELLDSVDNGGIRALDVDYPCDECTQKTKCNECFIEWLQSEVEE